MWLLAAGPAFAAAPIGGPPVVTVQLLAPPGTDLSGLEDLLAQAPGAPLSRSAVRRTLQLLDETGRFEDVLAYTQPMPGGVALLFRLVPRLRITALGFHGNAQLSDDVLRQKSGLQPGDEYVPERVRAAALAIEESYRRAGYPSVQVTWDVTQGTTQAQVEFQVDEGKPLRVRRIEITGQPRLSAELVQGALRLETNSIVDLDAVDDALHRLSKLYRTHGYFAAQVGPAAVARAEGELADLQLPVQAGPVYRFWFEGNRTFSDRVLLAVLDYDGEESFDDSVLQRLVDRLREFYRHEGFLLSTIEVESRRTPGGVDEIFKIEEDRPYRVSKLELAGVEGLDRQQLTAEVREVVRGDPRQPFFGMPQSATLDSLGVSGRAEGAERVDYRPDPDVYVPEVYTEAVARLAEHYHEEGFLSARVEAPRLDIDLRRHQVTVRISVREGPRTRLERVEFRGNEHLAHERLLQLSGLVLTRPLARSALERARKALLRGLAQEGHFFARVEAEQQVDPSGQFGVLRFRIREGPAVTVGRILFRGNVHTRDTFLRQNVGLVTGQRFDPEALQHSQQRLQQLGIFDQVQVALLEPEIAEPIKDLLVTLHERHPEGVVVGGGFSLIEGPRGYVEYTHVNLFGRAILFQTELRLNYFPWSYLALSNPTGSLVLDGLPPAQALTGKDNFFGFGGRLNAVLTDPRAFRLFGADGVMRHEVLIERIDRPYYAFSRAAVIPGVALVFGRKLTLGLQYDLEYDQINTYWANLDQVFSRLSFFDLTNLRFPNGQGVSGSLGPTISYDLRDDPVNPRRGFVATIKSSWVYGFFTPSGASATDTLFGSSIPGASISSALPIDLFSASGSVAGYVPIGPAVAAISLKGGRIFPVGNSFVIPTQRFFLGGPDSNRGFPIDMMLPQDVRVGLGRDVSLCRQSASGASCSTAAQILRTGGNQLPSPGGEVFENLRGELRFPIYRRAIDGAVFMDVGNLWADPARFDLFTLRPAAGAGVRVPTPIGPAAFDVGFNLAPDSVVNESIFQLFLSIGLF